MTRYYRTKDKLAQQGYIVDPRKAEEIAREPHCTVCQEPLKHQEFDGIEYYTPTHCRAHRKHTFSCDSGHCWQATHDEDDAAGHRCPTCGEYWQ